MCAYSTCQPVTGCENCWNRKRGWGLGGVGVWGGGVWGSGVGGLSWIYGAGYTGLHIEGESDS